MDKQNISSVLLKKIKSCKSYSISIIFIVNCILLTVNCFSQPVTQEWVRRWPGNPPISSTGISIKQDSFGYIYVLADTGSGFGFLKYNGNGDLLLHATYWPGGSFTSGGGEYFDVAPNGDVYITGDINIYVDTWIYTVKFNSIGVFQWGRLYNRDVGDGVEDMKIDRYNNVIIVGGSYDGNNYYALTIKYNSAGDTLWTSYFNQPPNYPAANAKVVLDSNCNIFITGNIIVPGIPGKCLILKYNQAGNLNWFNTFTLDATRANLGIGIEKDILGNVYVVGTQKRPLSQFDTYLLKLNSNGDTLWSRVYQRYGPGNNSLWGPVISADGNAIYYTASVYDTVGIGYNIATLKYNSVGDIQWARIYNGGIPNNLNLPSGIKLDKYGNVYVSGTGYYQTSGSDFLTMRYSPTGSLQWTAVYAGFVTNGVDIANDLLIDSNLVVYTTGGSTKPNSQRDAVLIKYNQPIGVITVNSQIPANYSLFQNYPNPFNPKSNIKFQIAKLSNVKLVVFDVLGREITVLVNQELKPGTYEVNWDASNYPSGVYFYRLTVYSSYNSKWSDEWSATKKMVLMK